METLFAPLGELEEYDQLIRGIKQGEFPVQLIGCMDTQESHMIYGTGRDKRMLSHTMKCGPRNLSKI